MKKETYLVITAVFMLAVFPPCVHAEESRVSKDGSRYGNTTNHLFMLPDDQPVNLYDSFYFSDGTAPFIRNSVTFGFPVLLTVWGFSEWDWGSGETFAFSAHSPLGDDAIDGGSDKFGHLYGTYLIKRASTFMYRATGSTPVWANIEGAIFAETCQLITEFGDGYSTAHGFDAYDLLFNNIGIAAGMILDHFPVLDRIFALQWEYVPTRYFRENFEMFTDRMDVPTDYSGQKYFLVIKLGGIPGLMSTILRYVNFELGYYSRGYHPKQYYSERTRNVQFGVSLNLSMLSGDMLPKGYLSSTAQTMFNYFHAPWDLEVKTLTPTEEPIYYTGEI